MFRNERLMGSALRDRSLRALFLCDGGSQTCAGTKSPGASFNPRSAGWGGPGWDLRVPISVGFPGDAGAPGVETTHGEGGEAQRKRKGTEREGGRGKRTKRGEKI